MEGLIRDLRYAFRLLRRNPGFTLAAGLTLALGIGANAALFTVVNEVLLRPLPYGEPDRIAVLWLDNRNEGIERDITSFPTFSDWRDRSTSFAAMAAYSVRAFNLTSGSEPQEILAARVTADFFEVLDVPPGDGRTFQSHEFVAGDHRAVVVSHGLWTRLGADPSLLDGTLRLNGVPYTVVGIMPPDFTYPDGVDVWLPLAPADGLEGLMERRGSLWLPVIGRLGGNVSLAQAQQEMSSIALRLEEEYPGNQGQGVRLEALHETVVGEVRPALLVVFGAVLFVLLIACANVANLLLARGTARRREVSVRLAVGAGRAQLVRQLVIESVVLSLMGGLVGLGLAAFAVRALGVAAPPGIPRLEGITVDRVAVGFTFLAALITGLLVGLAPAFQTARASLATILRDEERTSGNLLGRMRPALVVSEIALALVMLTGAGLMVRTFIALGDIDPGFRAGNLLSVRVTPPPSRYPESANVLAFYDQLLTRIRAIPGVQDAGGVSAFFLSRLPNMSSIAVEGAPPAAPDAPVVAVAYDAVTPGFLETARLRLLHGRGPASSDVVRSGSVAIVNESFVNRFLDGGEALGRRFTFGNPAADSVDWITVVGVTADALRAGPTEPVRPEALIPHGQYVARSMTLFLRTEGDPLAMVPAVRAALRSIDPEIPLAQIATVEQQMADAQTARRFVLNLLLLFAALAAVLAAVGIYGVMSYLVSRRTRELGIRMAVGARGNDVVRLVLRDALVQIGPGILLGVAGSLALTRLLRTQLFGVDPIDPIVLVAGAAILGVVGLLASFLPARRAAAVHPLDALRQE